MPYKYLIELPCEILNKAIEEFSEMDILWAFQIIMRLRANHLLRKKLAQRSPIGGGGG
jgi:hypothetical protein